jgi:lipid-binding SYLF domain-containing protein
MKPRKETNRMKLTNPANLLAATAAGLLTLLTASCTSGPGGRDAIASNTDARGIERKSRTALEKLYQTNPKARTLANKAEGVLVFPDIVKGGLVWGGAYGDGALYQRNRATGYYRSISASWGLQAGLQKYGYALFLMDDKAMGALNASGGWEIGSAPNLTVVDKGMAGALSTTTLDKGTYAVFFDQKGLMAGLGLQGTKVTRLAIQR